MLRGLLRKGVSALKNTFIPEAVSTFPFKMASPDTVHNLDVEPSGTEVKQNSDTPDSSGYENNSAAQKNENSSTDFAKNVTKTGTSESEHDVIKKRLPDQDENDRDVKKLKTDDDEKGDVEAAGRPYRKKKVAMLMVYSGKGYLGMQRNPGMRTIEEDLFAALVKAGVVTEDHASKPGVRMGFQRAARTDKGVSAAGQLVSLKMFIDVEDPVSKINSHLSDQIRVLGIKRTTKGFNSKNACSARTYIYMLPTFSFTPIEQPTIESYRVPSETLQRVNEILALYKGTHNFHNFTSGKTPDDPSAKRYIIDMKCGEPFMCDDLEYAVITVKGQSFMIHQIRKLIGLMLAIVRGLTGVEAIDRAWGPEKADIPKAPGLGLVLDKLHYDGYNKRYGGDGVHEPIDWDEYQEQIEKFKKDFIFKTITETEKREKSMMRWLSTLHLHHFGARSPSRSPTRDTGIGQAFVNVEKLRRAEDEKSAVAHVESSDEEGNQSD